MLRMTDSLGRMNKNVLNIQGKGMFLENKGIHVLGVMLLRTYLLIVTNCLY